ncbi:MAG: hypothetical protein ACLP01_22140 [Solirubrobacteraceae bacterium]
MSEPFASLGDTNLYAAVPGNAFDSFAGTGWTLSGGANIKTAALADGTTSSVLDLPAGAEAVSPPMCVAYDYPTARIMARALTGTQSLTLLAGYLTSNTSVATSYSNSSLGSGWALSPILQTHPGNQTGWQLVVFTLKASSTSSDTQVYNFYVDPRMVG